MKRQRQECKMLHLTGISEDNKETIEKYFALKKKKNRLEFSRTD